MARIRSVKPGFWTDSKIVALSPFARLFFIGMWNFAECDMGHVKDDAGALKLLILPTDDVSGDDLLKELLTAGRVVRLDLSDGRTFLHIPRFTDHQNLSTHWSPRCPGCQEQRSKLVKVTQKSADVTKFEEVSTKVPKEGKGGEGLKTSSPAKLVTVDDPDFDRFWSAYPRKVGKGEARKAWAKIRKSGVDAAAIVAGAERYRDDPQRRRKDIEFTKHPGPWLNAERWTDQLNGNDLAPTGGWWNN